VVSGHVSRCHGILPILPPSGETKIHGLEGDTQPLSPIESDHNQVSFEIKTASLVR
jgi:hypothetical protein